MHDTLRYGLRSLATEAADESEIKQRLDKVCLAIGYTEVWMLIATLIVGRGPRQSQAHDATQHVRNACAYETHDGAQVCGNCESSAILAMSSRA